MWYEALHQASLFPVIAMIAVGRRLPRRFWWVAWAFAVSWFADSLHFFEGQSWTFTYFWFPLQFWFVLCASTHGLHRALLGLGLLATAALSWDLTGPGPDYLIMFVGSVAVLWLARGTLAVPVFLYFGLGTLAYFIMVAGGTHATSAWYAYQGCRLTAILAFIGIIAPQVIRHRGPANGDVP